MVSFIREFYGKHHRLLIVVLGIVITSFFIFMNIYWINQQETIPTLGISSILLLNFTLILIFILLLITLRNFIKLIFEKQTTHLIFRFKYRLLLVFSLGSFFPTILILFLSQKVLYTAFHLTNTSNVQVFPFQTLHALYPQYQLAFIAILLCVISCGIWLVNYQNKHIVNPIESLIQATEEIAKGNLDIQLKPHVTGEIGILVSSFNFMIQELKNSNVKVEKIQNELLDANQNLELQNIFAGNIITHTRNAIFLIDKDGYIINVNLPAIELFQIKVPVINKHYKSILPKYIIQRLKWIESLELGQKVQKNMLLQLDKRSLHVLLETFRLTDSLHNDLGYLLAFEDLTELDRATRARAWQSVARRIAHEIKNPLTPIRLAAERLRKKYLSTMKNSDILDECTQSIIEQVNDLTSMVSEFSNFARIPEITLTLSNINKLVQEVYLFYANTTPLVTFNLNLYDTIPNSRFDMLQMRGVFNNLLNNAITALQETNTPNPQITLRTAFDSTMQNILIHIIDNGDGIPLHLQSHIFDPYITTKKKGSGLGLAIVERTIADHNGFINYTNNIKNHSTFTIKLPITL